MHSNKSRLLLCDTGGIFCEIFLDIVFFFVYVIAFCCDLLVVVATFLTTAIDSKRDVSFPFARERKIPECDWCVQFT